MKNLWNCKRKREGKEICKMKVEEFVEEWSRSKTYKWKKEEKEIGEFEGILEEILED